MYGSSHTNSKMGWTTFETYEKSIHFHVACSLPVSTIETVAEAGESTQWGRFLLGKRFNFPKKKGIKRCKSINHIIYIYRIVLSSAAHFS